MYAIIADGGRQYRVEEGQEILLDYRDIPTGEKFTLDRVLAIGNGKDVTLGGPTISGAKVAAEVLGPKQGPKLVIQKMRRRKNFRKKTGFRAMYTRVKIGKISS